MSEPRPAKALKLVPRIPTLVYAAGLGRLLGRRFVLLAHRGRKSGLERKVVLEAIGYESLTAVAFRPRSSFTSPGGRKDERGAQTAPAAAAISR